MAETLAVGDVVRGAAVREHPAVKAWLRVRPEGGKPAEVTVLKRKAKTVICRLSGPGGPVVVAKRCSQQTAQVERTVYADVLSQLPVPSLRYYGCVEEPEGRYGWLFLEEAVGDRYSPALEEHRRFAGRWLGLLHTSAAHRAGDVPLPDRGPGHFWQCLVRVRGTLAGQLGNPALRADDVVVLKALVAGCEALAARWGQVEQLCAKMPRTLVHGDFIRRNLRVRAGPAGPTLVALDWEVAGWGPPVVDLAGPPFGACPDLTAYREVVVEIWPSIDPPTLQRLGALGNVLRFLVAADWAAPNLADAVDKSMARLAVYRGGLADALRALGWED
jgi:Phosphotransferase enzyme family